MEFSGFSCSDSGPSVGVLDACGKEDVGFVDGSGADAGVSRASMFRRVSIDVDESVPSSTCQEMVRWTVVGLLDVLLYVTD